MSFLKKLNSLRKQKFTFMFIPHNGKKVKQIKFNKAFIITILCIITFISIFFVGSTFFLYKQNNFLNTDLQIKNDQINNLNIIAEQQNLEIVSLKNTSKLVIDKLSQLYALEDQVRNMVGLESTDSEQKVTLTSRSLDTRIDGVEDTMDLLGVDDITTDESADTISNLIEKEKGNYDQLIKDVEKQLKFLESKPDQWPTTGRITSKFGYRRHPISGKTDFHKGIDIANNSGTKITAAGSGVVTFSGWNGGYGRVIIVSHGYGYKSVYAHNQQNLVKVGQRVEKGEVIAELGNTGRSTGPHLHFEVYYNGSQIDPSKILKDK